MSEMLSRIYILLMITGLPIYCPAQQTSIPDSAYLMLHLKTHLLPYMNNLRQYEQVERFFSDTLEYRVLTQRGFSENIVFVEVHLAYDKKTHHQFAMDSYLIVAYDAVAKSLFRLKGFRVNDFSSFFNDVRFSRYVLRAERRFLNQFFVENLDLKCLYRQNKRMQKKNTSPCLKPARGIFGHLLG